MATKVVMKSASRRGFRSPMIKNFLFHWPFTAVRHHDTGRANVVQERGGFSLERKHRYKDDDAGFALPSGDEMAWVSRHRGFKT